MRAGPIWAGGWRQRLALKGAVDACRLAERQVTTTRMSALQGP
ncbi:hypothetical protein [Mesorhizobium sp. KR2-14]